MNENLTPQIVAALLQDGTIKMTGEEIATAIADAVGGLEKQYRFRGVATPDLAPGKILEPTLYVAVADATYPSFSGQSVDNGQIAFFTSDDGAYWDMTLAYNPQPEPGPGPSPTPSTGVKVIVSTADWSTITDEGVAASSIAGLAELIGMSEDDLSGIFDAIREGGVLPIILRNDPGSRYTWYYLPKDSYNWDVNFDARWQPVGGQPSEIEIAHDGDTFSAYNYTE